MTDATIGHNGGPPLDDPAPAAKAVAEQVEALVMDLEIANIDATVRSRDLVAALKTFGEAISTADDAHKLIALIGQMGAFTKATDDKRKEAKAPHDLKGKAVDGFFRPLIDPVAEARTAALDLLSAYMRSKAEGDKDKATIRTDLGLVASLSDDVSFTITNPESVPLEYWKIDESAVKAAVKKDVPIPGVKRDVTRTAGVR